MVGKMWIKIKLSQFVNTYCICRTNSCRRSNPLSRPSSSR